MSTKLIAIIVSVLLVGGGVWYFTAGKKSQQVNYTFTEIKRGEISSVVSSTGTLAAVGTVTVGTQTSGTIQQVFVDFNQHVSKGQPLAQLDPTALQSAVNDTQANVDKARAAYNAAQDDYNRNAPLLQKGFIAARDFEQTKSTLAQTKASLQSAQAQLDRAKTNLGYAIIRSPIDGTVIQRSVDPGQTVAASLSTPTMFIIAQDFSRMQIMASVDESDIGQIKVGQNAHFTVQAFADKEFTGTVTQIRVQPTTTQNVVNYTVVIDADNPGQVLLPGMTATIDFEVEKVTNVLMVPNVALRFQPTAEMLAEYQKRQASGQDTSGGSRSSDTSGGRRGRSGDSASTGGNRRSGDSSGTARRGGSGGTAGRTGGTGGAGRSFGASRALPKGVARLWYIDSLGQLNATMVRTGLTDGTNTEIKSGRGISEGMKIISGVVDPNAAKKPTSGTGSTNPLVTPGAGGGGGGRRGP